MPTTSNFGWTTPADTDLVKNGALAIRTLGNGIDTSMAELKGGTTGQVLSKSSNTDMDFTWVTTDDANAIQNAIVDAKGDLIAATANDTPARLAVGNNGETLVADSSTTTGLRYNPQNALANPVINGGMDLWQRGTSFTGAGTNNTYVADRWASGRQGQSLTVTRQTVSDTTNLPNIQYSLRMQRPASNANTTTAQLAQSFETVNSIPYVGKAITLSFYARRGANYSGASNQMEAYVTSGTGTDQSLWAGYTGSSNFVSGSVTLTTTWQRFALTGTVPSTATQIGLFFNALFSGTAGADDWIEITGVQIDLGTYTASSAPTFRRSGGTLAGELAACQRYYYRIQGTGANYPFGFAQCYTTTTGGALVQFPVTMRTRPTALEQSGTAGHYQVYSAAGAALALTAVPTYAAVVTTEQLGAVNFTVGSGLVAGNVTQFTASTSSAYLGWSAEL